MALQGKGTLLPDNGAAGRGPRYLVMYLEHLQFYVKVLSEKPASTLIKNEQILRDVLVDGPARTLARMVFELKTYKEAETLGMSPNVTAAFLHRSHPSQTPAPSLTLTLGSDTLHFPNVRSRRPAPQSGCRSGAVLSGGAGAWPRGGAGGCGDGQTGRGGRVWSQWPQRCRWRQASGIAEL